MGDPSDLTAKITTAALTQEYINVFRNFGGTTIDTSRRYSTNAPGTSELLLGTTDILTWATIDTKVLSNPGDHAPENIATSISKSLEALKVSRVHIIYCHFPDRTQPLESVCSSMAKGIEKGKMEHWGISNYSIDEVKKIINICEANKYPKPVVYQGHYNALTRKMEEKLLPVLRQNKIAFYAYSPAAGGAFSRNSSRMASEVGRLPSTIPPSAHAPQGALGNSSRSNYHSSSALSTAISHVQEEAEKHNLTGHEVALRWVRFHSALKAELGDAMIVGASSPAQLETTMKGLEAGPLPEEVSEAVDGVWESARESAPDYSPFLERSEW